MIERFEPGEDRTMQPQLTNSSAPSFELFESGPVFGQPWPRLSAGRRIAIAVLVTWVPLVALAAIQGLALGPTPSESVLRDAAIYVRFLVALPLLLLTPTLCGDRLRKIAHHFLEAELVKESEREQFSANITSTIRLRDSRVAQAALMALVYLAMAYFAIAVVPNLPATWRTRGVPGHRSLSLVGWWFILVSQPLYVYVMLHFVNRVGLWWRFLWKTSRLDLQLRPTHGDGAAGLAFMGLTLITFAPPVFAIAASVAGGVANLVLWTGVSVVGQKNVILAVVALMVALFLTPLLLFFGKLKEAKHEGLLEYGVLSGRQLAQFEQKWLDPHLAVDADVLGAVDFRTVNASNATVSRTHGMRLLPFHREELLVLGLAALLPFLPVAALEVPWKEILKELSKLVS
jgi:hypothetical protein